MYTSYRDRNMLTFKPIKPNKELFIKRHIKWSNDIEVTKYLYQGTFQSDEDDISRLYYSYTNNNNIVYFLYIDGSIDPIGIVGIYDIHWPSKVGEFRILIGEKDCWGKGYGSQALEMITKIAFETYGLHKFWLGYNADHKMAEKAYSKCGFKHECVIKSHFYKNGKYSDIIRMYMLREDYEKWIKLQQD